MTVEQIMAIESDSNGWRKLPNGNYVTLGNGVKLGDDVTLGDGVKLGNYVTLGDGVTSLQLVEQIIAALPDTMTATKWVTPDRMSPNFDGGSKIHYAKGETIEATNAVLSDQQCGPGLHVLVNGYRPEWAGLCPPKHNYIPLSVSFRREDVCFAGTPGNNVKWRVKKLTVLD